MCGRGKERELSTWVLGLIFYLSQSWVNSFIQAAESCYGVTFTPLSTLKIVFFNCYEKFHTYVQEGIEECTSTCLSPRFNNYQNTSNLVSSIYPSSLTPAPQILKLIFRPPIVSICFKFYSLDAQIVLFLPIGNLFKLALDAFDMILSLYSFLFFWYVGIFQVHCVHLHPRHGIYHCSKESWILLAGNMFRTLSLGTGGVCYNFSLKRNYIESSYQSFQFYYKSVRLLTYNHQSLTSNFHFSNQKSQFPKNFPTPS